MTVPVFDNFTEAKEASGATFLTISKPVGIVEDDLMVAVIVTDSSSGGITSSGWTGIVGQAVGNVSTQAFYKMAGLSEPSSYTFNWPNTEQSYGFIMRVTGHDTDIPINVSGLANGISASPTCPTINTTSDECLVLRIFGADDDDITVDGGYPSGTTGITVDKSSADAGSCSGGAAYESQVTAGATGTAAFSLTASEDWSSITIAIQPSGAVSTSPSSSPSASISASPSTSLSASISASLSSSISSSPSGTPSASLSSSISASPSASLSASISSSLSASISSSPSASISSSISSSLSASISASPSGTPSTSVSSSISASPSVTPSASISASPSATPTGSPSASASASPSSSGDELDTSGFGEYESGGTSQHVENTFVNLSHLEGETVKICGTDVDDETTAYDDETVSGGIITLMELSPHAHNFVRKATVGLPFRYTLSPMRLDLVTAGGSSHGSIGHIAEIVISFLDTLNAKQGSSLDDLKDIDWDSLTSLNTGDFVVPFDGGYSIDDTIYISGDDVFGCTVRAIIPRKDKTGR